MERKKNYTCQWQNLVECKCQKKKKKKKKKAFKNSDSD